MFNHKLTNAQLWAWLFSAMSAPVAIIAGGCSWQEVLVIGGLCTLACWFVLNCVKNVTGNRWLCVVQILWSVAVLGTMSRWTDQAWPTGESYPAVPIILLLLAAAASNTGAEKSARIGGVLFWVIALIYGGVILAGSEDLRIEIHTVREKVDMRLIPVFLVSALAVYLPVSEKRGSHLGMTGILVMGIAFAVCVTGGLSSEVQGIEENPFYEWIRSLSLAGTAQRFESVVSAGLTMGWFLLYSYLLSAVGHLSEVVWTGNGRKAVWICAGLVCASTFLKRWIPITYVAGGCVLLWIALPMLMSLWKIKMENSEKSA